MHFITTLFKIIDLLANETNKKVGDKLDWWEKVCAKKMTQATTK